MERDTGGLSLYSIILFIPHIPSLTVYLLRVDITNYLITIDKDH